jgi:23S rRNA pseudouridine2605 synthase
LPATSTLGDAYDRRRNMRSPHGKPPSPGQRKTLDRALSRAGLMSRSQAQQAIAQGRVRVNGLRVFDAQTWVDPERDRIEVDDAALEARKHVYMMLNKPVGFVTTRSDERGRETVYALLGEHEQWVAPVGRLDRDTSGLLLFTNDSDWAERVTNPASKLFKRYECVAHGALSDEQLERLRAGVQLDDGPTAPARVRRLGEQGGNTRVELAIGEGRNRQIRRMLEAVGSRVIALHRVAVGPLELGALAPGAQRKLKPFEIRALGGGPV